MRQILRIVLALVGAVIILALAGATWKRDEIARLMAVNTLFEPDRIVANFSDMQAAFLFTPIDAPRASALPVGAPMSLPPGVEEWLKARRVTSLLVLHEGTVVAERYLSGTSATDNRIGWSLSKSYISALTGILLDEGAIGSLDDPVTDYVPALAEGAYSNTTIRHVLTMTTGVRFDEDYDDPRSDINRMGRVLALGRQMDAFAIGLTDTDRTPGGRWHYVSIDTHVLAMVLRAATGRDIVDLLREKIFAPLGAEGTPYYLTDGVGTAFALGGINATTRDYARFGQLFLQGGTWQDRQIIRRDWVLASTSAQAPTAPDAMGYGFQWWLPHDARPREYMARGIYGQYLYVNEEAQVVIALTATDPDFRAIEVRKENVAMFRRIAESL